MIDADLPSVEIISERLAAVNDRIRSVGADPASITVVGVTKMFPVELARRAVAAGLSCLGENYAQDLETKLAALGPGPGSTAGGGGPDWHFIGGLQRNKIKRLVGLVSVWETIDRLSLVTELAKRDPGAAIMIQVNTTGEAQKSGCRPDEAASLVDQALSAGLRVEGLMTVGPTDGSDPGPAFERLAALADQLELEGRSMGMSGDFERAAEAGATVVRLGSVLFGPRPSS